MTHVAWVEALAATWVSFYQENRTGLYVTFRQSADVGMTFFPRFIENLRLSYLAVCIYFNL